jgi:D-glycero-alpha-D-manno-heptose-7-phosphate kinase
MIRSRAPLRLGLAGGGTDLASYSDVFGGAVLNVTIDRYAYAHLTRAQGSDVYFEAADLGRTDRVQADPALPLTAGLALHRAVYNRIVRDFLGAEPPALRISTTVDAPAGSGLGSSSALVVAMVEAYRTAFDLPLGPYDVAHLAYEIERVDLALAGGKQDQYSASFGGLNFMEFLPEDRVIVNPLRISRSVQNELEAALFVCFTGQSQRSEKIIDEQLSGIGKKAATTVEGLHTLKSDAIDMKSALLRGDLHRMSDILNHSWQAKQATAKGIATSTIMDLHRLAMDLGAWTGKVSGAGGGGFMMFMIDPGKRHRTIAALRERGIDANPVQFVSTGAEAWHARR